MPGDLTILMPVYNERSTIDEILAPKPVARPRIYAYSIDDQAHAGLLKIGQTTRDVKRRAGQAIRWMLAHGVTHIRTHVDICDPSLTALHTPGHCANHLCFELETEQDCGILFSADHVMSWSTSVVSPPDGDMADYMRSLDRVMARDDRLLLPGHGAPLTGVSAIATRCPSCHSTTTGLLTTSLLTPRVPMLRVSWFSAQRSPSVRTPCTSPSGNSETVAPIGAAKLSLQ